MLFNRATLEVRKESATDPAGRERDPEERVRPEEAVNNPAEVMVPVPVVRRELEEEMVPEVEMVILEAKSEPAIEPERFSLV